MVGEAPAGRPFGGDVGPGETVRIFTGGPVPAGADAILIQENAQREGDCVIVAEPVSEGRYIRPAGLDFAAGEVLLPAGRLLRPRDIGLAAAVNAPWLPVVRRPVVAILATGDEIVLPGDPVEPGQIVSSNSWALAAFVERNGGTAAESRHRRRRPDRAAGRRPGHGPGRPAGDDRRRLGRRARPDPGGARPRSDSGSISGRSPCAPASR